MEYFSSEIILKKITIMFKLYFYIKNLKLLLTAIAEINVRTIIARAIIVAIILDEENIFLICFKGPIKKHVLK